MTAADLDTFVQRFYAAAREIGHEVEALVVQSRGGTWPQDQEQMENEMTVNAVLSKSKETPNE